MNQPNRYVDPFEAFKARKEASKNAPKFEKLEQMTVKKEGVQSFQSHRFEKKELSPEEIQKANLQAFTPVRTTEEVQKVELLQERAKRVENIEVTEVQGLHSGRHQKVESISEEKASGFVSHRHQKTANPVNPTEIQKPKGFSKY